MWQFGYVYDSFVAFGGVQGYSVRHRGVPKSKGVLWD